MICPKCGGATEALFTPSKGKPRGIRCTECPWSQFPGNAPPLSSTPESRQRAGKHAEFEASLRKPEKPESYDAPG
jgi:hypothetical protein